MTDQLIGDIAVEAIDQIMERKRIPKLSSGITIESNATFAGVMQYLWYYVGNGATARNPQFYPRHRTDFYKRILNLAQIGRGPIQHIDIGCGGGTFTQALLECCQEQRISSDNVAIYAYDHALNAVKAAKRIHRLIQRRCTENIPPLHCLDDYESMLNLVPQNQSNATHYIITAGYVLANNLDQQAIGDFTAIITSVVDKSGDGLCSLVVCDTGNASNPDWAMLEPEYDRLVESLEARGVVVNTRRQNTGWRVAELI